MTPEILAEVMEATWPAARTHDIGPFRLREGAGGGKRVSAATAERAWTEADLSAAEAAMSAEQLFLIRAGDTALDASLAARGYRIVDSVIAYCAPASTLAGALDPLAAFPHWPPLQIARSLWAEGGIGPERIAVMARARGAKAALLARMEDKPVGVAFVALHGSEAMLHALEVGHRFRRKGAGQILLKAAANWAMAQGAARLSLVVTERNVAARTMYARVGMEVVGQYHYRKR